MKRRVALIYDDTIRLETTGTYCLRALEQLSRVEHFLPTEMDRIPRGTFDLFITIDDGLEYRLPDDLRPSVFWAIDTHLEFERTLNRSQDIDLVFTAQRDGAEDLRAQGIDMARWLPLACDAQIHGKQNVPKQFDICFVGNVFPGQRREFLNLIRERYAKTFLGRCYFEEMARTYGQSKIVFNCAVRNDINMRVFEALCSGSLLMTNNLTANGQDELFRDGVHLATYADGEELLDKLDFYLDRNDLRERIAAAGRHEVLARHTYRHRMQELLSQTEQHLFSRTMVSVTRKVENHTVDSSSVELLSMPHSTKLSKRGFRDLSYFEFSRPELLALVSPEARHVLDVGCAAGALGAGIKDRQSVEVWGIELNEDAAEEARQRLDRVIRCDAERINGEIPSGTFDCIICGDVLEHMRSPLLFLQQARSWLAPGGRLVASIPNVRHHSVVASLLAGNWTYESAGLLDETHLQFFTRRDIADLFEKAGFVIELFGIVPGPGYQEWSDQGRPGCLRIGSLSLDGLTPEEAEEFFVYQYLLRAVPAQRRDQAEPMALPEYEKHTEGIAVLPDRDRGAISPIHKQFNSAPGSTRQLSILYVGDFQSPGKSEQYAAGALANLGHRIHSVHDAEIDSPNRLLEIIGKGDFDCFLFYKGCLGAKTVADRLHPSGEAISEVLRNSPVPGYTWYFDRVYKYDLDPSREVWMKHVAPLCRVAFVTDGALAKTDWGNFHLLRQGVCRSNVEQVHVGEAEKADVAFIGQIYGDRELELKQVCKRYRVNVISGVFDRELNGAMRGHKIILGPRFPSIPGYWSNRLYVVLGHGGFFLAPEVEGMRDEGFVPGLHYAPLGEDPITDMKYWLNRPAERERIARAGQELVLSAFTYQHRAAELARVIASSL